MSALTLREIARALGGEVQGKQVLAPGPGHSRTDRSLSVRLSAQSPTGWITFSHAGDRFDVCRDFVAEKLGLGSDAWKRWPNGKHDNIIKSLAARSGDLLYNVQEVASDNSARIARAVAIWNEAGSATGSLAETYLAGRGLDLNLVSNIHEVIRFHPRTPWRDEAENRTILVPCMVALMRSATTDEPQAIHRTRLSAEGAKLGRRMLGQASGAAIKLDADDTVTMGLAIGEGIETCLAAHQIGIQPVWALASAGAIERLPVLAGIESLSILAETDETNARAINACGTRWHAAGREVTIIEPVAGSDINDALRSAA